MQKRGRFITLEGVEGAGKSTNAPFIQQHLQTAGHQVLLTREPGGTSTGEAIREILLNRELPPMHKDTELLLMFAARAEHLKQKIEPALQNGKWVLCDRFTDASFAYQGGGRGIKIRRIAELERWVQGKLRPDLTLLFDVDAETGLGRAKSRGQADRFEQEDIDFFNRVRDQYLRMAEHHPQRYRVIDARWSIQDVQQQLASVLDEFRA